MRIGINVPNELLHRVKAIRPEVNVSQICREALESRAAEAERITQQADIDRITEHILRLVESDKAPLLEPDWVGMALEDARDWVRAVDVDLWYDFCRDYDERLEDGNDVKSLPGFWAMQAKTNGLWQRHDETREWYFKQMRLCIHSPAKRQAVLARQEKDENDYRRIWLGYVLEARRRLQEYLDAECERQTARREQERKANFSEPELPPQMVEYHKANFGRPGQGPS